MKKPIIVGLLLFIAGSLFAANPISHLPETPSASSSIHFLSLADIHFDPFISCQNKVPCPLVEKLRQAPANQWAMILAKYDTALPQDKQDSNYPLLVSALQAAKKVGEAKHVQFVLILGDFLGHDFRSHYKKYSTDPHIAGYVSFVKKTFEFLMGELQRTFPTTDVYTVVGNNDSYQGDYFSKPKGRFFQEMATRWSGLIKNKSNQSSMAKTFATAGYYALTIPGQPELRLIVLNSNLFSSERIGRGLEEAANQELEWLHKELIDVKEKHQKAFIAMHIPMGIDIYKSLRVRLFTLLGLWQSSDRQRFQVELQEFSQDISAVFTGHLHSDFFQVMNLGRTNAILMAGTPSISPIFGNNPGFKIYAYSAASLALEDFITYYFPLNNEKAWGMENDFNRLYQPNCHDCPHFSSSALWAPYYWCAIGKWVGSDDKMCAQIN